MYSDFPHCRDVCAYAVMFATKAAMSPHAYLTAPKFPKPKDTRLPEPENRAFKTMPDGREICRNHPETGTSEGRKEYKRRLRDFLLRQNGICCLAAYAPMCPGPLELSEATFEHENGRSGGRRDDREVLSNGKRINGAAHYACNQWKGSRRIKYND